MIPLFLSITFIGSFALMSHHNGVAEEQGKDRTGAPGSDQPCTHCHSTGAAVPTSSIAIIDADGVEISEYTPGAEYDVEFRVESNWAIGFGFQGTAIVTGGDNAGIFSNPGTNVQLESVNGRHIVEHSDEHPTGVFSVVWTAPEVGAGDVAFFNAGLAANGAYGNNGDSYHGTALTITEGEEDGISGLATVEIKTPFTSEGRINWTAHDRGQISVYDLNGKIVESLQVSIHDVISIETSRRGVYIFQFTGENNSIESWKIAA